MILACSFPDCAKPVYNVRGWCSKHYQRWRKHGDPAVVKQIQGDDEARFWSKVDRNGPVPEHRPELGPCWLWTGQLDQDGYAVFAAGGRTRKVFRWAQEHFVGPIPEGLVPDHLCRVRACVNYERHLEPVTGRVNLLRGMAPSALNARRTHCVNGHPFDEANTGRRSNGGRYCRRCAVENSRRSRRRHRQAC